MRLLHWSLLIKQTERKGEEQERQKQRGDTERQRKLVMIKAKEERRSRTAEILKRTRKEKRERD